MPPEVRPEEVRFLVQEEDWSKYEVLDGRVDLWVRAILVKLYKLPEEAEGNYATATQTLVRVFVEDDSLKSEPSDAEYSPEELENDGQDIDFNELDTPWNEYVVQGPDPQLVRTKVVLTNVRYHPDKHSSTGDPIFQVDSQVVVGKPRDAEGFVPK